jgi:hypothetical protein
MPAALSGTAGGAVRSVRLLEYQLYRY